MSPITFHASPTGAEDYLDFHTPDGDRFYLSRDEARALATAMLAATSVDVACGTCGRQNGVHTVTCQRDSEWLAVVGASTPADPARTEFRSKA